MRLFLYRIMAAWWLTPLIATILFPFMLLSYGATGNKAHYIDYVELIVAIWGE